MLPFRGVGMFAHALHPRIGIANENDWQDVCLVDSFVVTGSVCPLVAR
jgi:hypothetical protein